MGKYSDKLKIRANIYLQTGIATLIIGTTLLAISQLWIFPNPLINNGFNNILVHLFEPEAYQIIGIKKHFSIFYIDPDKAFNTYSLIRIIVVITCFGGAIYAIQKKKYIFIIAAFLCFYTFNEYLDLQKFQHGTIYTNASEFNEQQTEIIKSKLNERLNIAKVNFEKNRSSVNHTEAQDGNIGLARDDINRFEYFLAQYYYIKNEPQKAYEALKQIDPKNIIIKTYDQRRVFAIAKWLEAKKYDTQGIKHIPIAGIFLLFPEDKFFLKPYVFYISLPIIISAIITLTLAAILFARVKRMEDLETTNERK